MYSSIVYMITLLTACGVVLYKASFHDSKTGFMIETGSGILVVLGAVITSLILLQ